MLVAAALVAAAPAVARPDGGPQASGTLRLALARDIDSLDPALAFTVESWGIENATCAPLLRLAPAPSGGIRLVPEAAEAPPRVADGGRTYAFTVRRGLRFSDGSAITAANFAVALDRARDPAMRSYARTLYADVASVRATGRRLVVRLARPNGDLPTRFALPWTCPVPRRLPVDPAGVDLLAGSGPYRVARRVRGELVVLERNRFYAGPRRAAIARAELAVVGNGDAAVRAVEQGRADFTGSVPPELRQQLVGRYGLGRQRLFRVPNAITVYVAMNMSRPLFRGNPRLRRAVNFALDRAEIVRSTGNPLGYRRTDQLLSEALPGWRDADLYPLKGPNLRVARRLASGNLRGGRAVLYTGATPFWMRQAEIIRFDLRQIGLDVEVKPFAQPVLQAKAGTPGEPYDLAAALWIADFPDPANMILPLLSPENARRASGNHNLSYFDDPAYGRRMTAAARLTGDARFRAFGRLERELLRDAAPVAPLFSSASFVFLSPRVGCYGVDPMYWIDLTDVCVR